MPLHLRRVLVAIACIASSVQVAFAPLEVHAADGGGAFLEGEWYDYSVGPSYRSYDEPTAVWWGTGVQVRTGADLGGLRIDFRGPDGAPLVPGVYEDAERAAFASPGHPGLSVSGEGRGCNQATGRFEIIEIGIDDGGDLTTFAARWEHHCEGRQWASTGMVVIGGDHPLVDRSIVPRRVEFDRVALGLASAPSVITLRNHGPGTDHVETVSIATVDGAGDPSDFEIVSDGCTGEVLHAGAECEVGVVFAPTMMGAQQAWLAIDDDVTFDGGAGSRVLLEAAATPASARLWLEGDAGDVPTGGGHWTYDRLTVTGGANGLSVAVADPDGGLVPPVEIRPPAGEALVPGAYEWSTTRSSGALVRIGSGVLCSSSEGWLVIDEIVVGANGLPSRVDARWKLRCGSDPAASVGAVQFNATAPFAERSVSPRAVQFLPGTWIGSTKVAAPVVVRNLGAADHRVDRVALAGPDADQFAITAEDCTGRTLVPAATCTVSVVHRPTRVSEAHQAVLVVSDRFRPVDDTAVGGVVTLSASSVPAPPASPDPDPVPVDPPPPDPPPGDGSARGEFTALTPARILDTRLGSGAPPGRVGPGAVLDVRVAGRGGVPSTGVSAVVMNVTAVAPTESTFVTVYPGASRGRPGVSNLNPSAGATVAAMVTVGVGADGTVSLANEAGFLHLVADVVGFYATEDGWQGSRFVPVDPTRLFDTRIGDGGVPRAPIGPGEEMRFDVGDYLPRLVQSENTAVVLNVTAARASERSYLTVHPGDVATPTASHLNFEPGQRVANLVTVRLPANGVVSFRNAAGDVDVVVDLVGMYASVPDEFGYEHGRFVPIFPERLLDSRYHPDGALGPDSYYAVRAADVAPESATAVAVNVTAVRPTEIGYLTAFPDDLCAIPWSSTVNFTPGQLVANSAIVGLSVDNECSEGVGWIDVYNPFGTTHVLVDAFGYFT